MRAGVHKPLILLTVRPGLERPLSPMLQRGHIPLLRRGIENSSPHAAISDDFGCLTFGDLPERVAATTQKFELPQIFTL